MNNDFPRIVTYLRKERGLSQKQAAADMGISQALLSHYEKGIRECSLDFLIKTAEYYNVSCDYLLGRTVQRNLAAITPDDLPDSDEINNIKGKMNNQVNKRLLLNTASVIFDMLARIGSKKLTNAVSNYLMSAEYRIFREIYSAEQNNSQTMFSISRKRYSSLCSASMTLDMEIIGEIIESDNIKLALPPDVISDYFKKGTSSLFSVIQSAERNIKSIYRHTDLNL